MSNPFDDLKVLFTKQGELSDTPVWYIINRSLSFNSKTFEIAKRMDKYIFHLDKGMLKLSLKILVPKMKKVPWFSYIKKPIEKSEEFDFLFKDLQKHFKWTNEKLKVMKPLILHIIEDKDKLKQILDFIGADLKYYKKYKISIDKPKPTGLGRWLK